MEAKQKWIKMAGTDYEIIAPIAIEGLEIPVFVTSSKTVTKEKMFNTKLAKLFCQTWFVKNIERVEIVIDDTKPPTIRKSLDYK